MSIDQALAKTRGGFLARLFGRGREEKVTPEWLDALEEGLLRADLSVSLVDPLMAQVRDLVATAEVTTVPKLLDAVRETLVGALAGDTALRGDGAMPRGVLVVLDGTAGQNAIQQARQFTATAAVTGIVVTKLDGTAKGGAVFAIAHELKLPVKFLGVGEKANDLVPMDARKFVDALLPAAY